MQDFNLNQLKLKINGTSKKDEEITTNIEPSNDEDENNESYLDEKISKIESHIPCIEKNYIEFKLLSNKQFVEDALNERAVKTTKQIINDKGCFDEYDNANDVLKDFLFVGTRRPDSEEVKNVIQ